MPTLGYLLTVEFGGDLGPLEPSGPADPRGHVCHCGEYCADHGAGSNHSPVAMDESSALDRLIAADPGGWDAFTGTPGDD